MYQHERNACSKKGKHDFDDEKNMILMKER